SLIAWMAWYRISRSIPSGSVIYSTGSPLERHCTPWYTEGRKPLPHTLLPASGVLPPEVSTTKPGRLLFSEPSPYVTHEPILGLPNRGWPVCTNNWAGP